MKKICSAKVISMIALLFVIGCGNDYNPGDLPITMNPASVTLNVGQTQQFTITAGGANPPNATWAVSDSTGGSTTMVPGGNATLGTVSASGLYTAPSTVPNPSQVMVLALKSGTSSNGSTTTILSSAVVTIVDTGGGGGQTPAATIVVSPTSIAPGGSATLTWTGVGSCLLDGESIFNGIAVGTGGSTSVDPSQTTTYTLACAASGNTTTAQATLTVQTSTTSPTSSGVTITPATITVNSGATVDLTATVANDPNNYGVVWTTTLGESSQPSALTSTTATYTVPVVTQTIVITVTATSIANNKSFGTSIITVNP